MEVTLKISVRNADLVHLDGVFNLVEKIKQDHPNLLQRVEVAIEC